ncbi:MAG: DUF5758 domain-containing protein, partial [Bacteroides sp.]|nr:DUF5758 domain-containing protein [Bacteroides sp.]
MSDKNYALCIRLIGELERLSGKDTRTANTKRMARIIIKKLKNKQQWKKQVNGERTEFSKKINGFCEGLVSETSDGNLNVDTEDLEETKEYAKQLYAEEYLSGLEVDLHYVEKQNIKTMNKKIKDVPLEVIERWLKDLDCDVRAAAMNACSGKDVPLKVIERGLKDSDCDVRAAAMNACSGKDVPLEVIERGLKDSDCDVRAAAMNACSGKDVPLEVIERGLKDSDWRVRTAAMNACSGKDVPLEVIERGLKDSDWRVRAAAMNACKKNGIKIPVIRTIEPPERVYKKCVGDVIVVAEIPSTAQVRGKEDGKCRASEAVIVDIIGDVAGEKVGISKYDNRVFYTIGDHVEIEDFDYSNEECSTGFHFFCTQKQAEEYK